MASWQHQKSRSWTSSPFPTPWQELPGPRWVSSVALWVTWQLLDLSAQGREASD